MTGTIALANGGSTLLRTAVMSAFDVREIAAKRIIDDKVETKKNTKR